MLNEATTQSVSHTEVKLAELREDRLKAMEKVNKIDEKIAALENAAAGPDYDALRDAAHSLKSSSANLGAMQLSAAAKRVELGARTGTLDRPAVEVARVTWEFERARDALLDALPRAEA